MGNAHRAGGFEARQAEKSAVRERKATATKARARTACDERNSFAMAQTHYGLNLRGRRRKQDRAGQYAEIRKAVAFVGVQFLRRADEATVADDRAEFVEDAKVHKQELTRWAAKPRRF